MRSEEEIRREIDEWQDKLEDAQLAENHVDQVEAMARLLALKWVLGEAQEDEMPEDNAAERLELIADWCGAYPSEDLKRANAILEEHGISLIAIHGEWARELLSGVARIARGEQ